MKAPAALVLAFLVTPMMSPVYATDWDSCASDLNNLRGAASDASDAAEEASSQEDEMESCDEFDDDCDFDRDEFESAASNAESEIDTVVARFRAVASSCDVARERRSE